MSETMRSDQCGLMADLPDTQEEPGQRFIGIKEINPDRYDRADSAAGTKKVLEGHEKENC